MHSLIDTEGVDSVAMSGTPSRDWTWRTSRVYPAGDLLGLGGGTQAMARVHREATLAGSKTAGESRWAAHDFDVPGQDLGARRASNPVSGRLQARPGVCCTEVGEKKTEVIGERP
ncbi:unnamed protein product [Durusdinium trenchii]|uniref:Uncharacterized protein n=1 Tax=Durusdinium trenchii TaxID=1381693 RepID=A0ABP0J3I8_9DINO